MQEFPGSSPAARPNVSMIECRRICGRVFFAENPDPTRHAAWSTGPVTQKPHRSGKKRGERANAGAPPKQQAPAALVDWVDHGKLSAGLPRGAMDLVHSDGFDRRAGGDGSTPIRRTIPNAQVIPLPDWCGRRAPFPAKNHTPATDRLRSPTISNDS